MRGNAISNSFLNSTWNRGDCWVQKRCGHWWSPGNFCPCPHHFWRGVVLEEREKSCNMMGVPFKTPLLPHKVTCSKSLRLKFRLNSIYLFQVWHFLTDLPHVNWEPLFILFLLRCSRETGWRRVGDKGRGTETERDLRKEAQIFQCVFLFPSLSLLKGHIDRQLLLSTVGLGWYCRVLGIPRCCLAWSCTPLYHRSWSPRRLYRETSSSA